MLQIIRQRVAGLLFVAAGCSATDSTPQAVHETTGLTLVDVVARDGFPTYFQGSGDVFVALTNLPGVLPVMIAGRTVRPYVTADFEKARSNLDDASARRASADMPLGFQLTVVREDADSAEVIATCDTINHMSNRRFRLSRRDGRWGIDQTEIMGEISFLPPEKL
jgi:hypothetical protein